MTKKHLPFFLFSLVSSLASGQYEAILKDPDVIWAAEMELTFWIEPEFSAPDSVYSKSNYSTVLKLSNHAIDPADESELLLSNRIFDLLYDDLIPVYARPENQQPLTQRERNTILNIKDTVTNIDPLTGEASISLVYNCWWSGSMQQIRVRQLLFYRDKTDEFELYTLAFAPILNRNYGPDPTEKYHPYLPFWFKMPPYRHKTSKTWRLDNPNIPWARRMRTGTNMPPLHKLHPYKDFNKPVVQQYFDRLREDRNFKIRDSNWKLMSMETREHYFSKVDTVVTFDPESYEETVTIVHNSLHAEDMMQLQLVQDWLWDERRRFPVFLLYAFAPLEDVKDQEGNLRFKRPLFWRMVRD